jgi:uncharacterized protein YdhG (YjbR/CyaY superfamily)
MPGKVEPEVEAYLDRVEFPAFRRALEALRALIRREAPDAEEVISYGQPTFKQDGHLVAYAAFKKHLSFFPMSSTIIAEHAAVLKDYKTSAGTVQFTPDKPIPDEIVVAMVRARLAQNAQIAADRKAKTKR